jgi:hypothetical protein
MCAHHVAKRQRIDDAGVAHEFFDIVLMGAARRVCGLSMLANQVSAGSTTAS